MSRTTSRTLFFLIFTVLLSSVRSSFVGTHSINAYAARDCSEPSPSSLFATVSRRAWCEGIASGLLFSAVTSRGAIKPAYADDEEPEPYENPNIPAGPEERSGLVVLRVAEVAQFQEKILRAVASGAVEDVTVTPQQIVFGTQILLRNSNLGGNMKLMIDNEVPRKLRKEAVNNAVKTMNTIQSISTTAGKIQRPFEKEEMIQIADLYRDVRLQLNQMYEYLPPAEKSKYYGYFMAVTE
uniref:Uncharacterized protein n=1 Tax=Ditylum brightwellii TaxID=49249 RepID=A0A7S2EFN9_9STRA|mmetsp:Transcript_27533/g.40925  ORF Transcript_27533/g.40925 Transcript_27533/m.40925 type:complete len:239 (+) Transcript_27533:527-1243(+)